MKKTLILLATAALAFTMTACDKKDDKASDSTKSTEISQEEEPAKASDQAIADKAMVDLKQSLAVQEFHETCGTVNWACEIVDMNFSHGNLHVAMQTGEIEPDEAERVATNIFNFIGKDNPEIEWVIVENGAGVVQGQISRNNVPLLN